MPAGMSEVRKRSSGRRYPRFFRYRRTVMSANPGRVSSARPSWTAQLTTADPSPDDVASSVRQEENAEDKVVGDAVLLLLEYQYIVWIAQSNTNKDDRWRVSHGEQCRRDASQSGIK